MPKSTDPTWSPSNQDLLSVIADQNPWLFQGTVPTALAHAVERSLAKVLWQRLITNRPRRFQLILGPRRVGKTTSLFQTVRHLLDAGIPTRRVLWLRLDHPLLITQDLGSLVRSACKSATAAEPTYLFLDELTYARDWDLWLKTFYDENLPVVIAASSSSTAALRFRRTESGVGRWEEQFLAPYLFPEYLALIKRDVSIPLANTLAETIQASIANGASIAGLAPLRRMFLLVGGFPELLIDSRITASDEVTAVLESQRTLRSDAVERAIYKDIPQAFGVDNPMLLERLLYTLAGQICGILSPRKLTQQLDGMSQPTFDKYISYLERAFIVFTLPNYSGSEKSIQKRGRRLYFVDGAVRNAALQRGIGPLSDSAEMGLLLENAAAAHLYALAQQAQVRLYHWRDGDDEVDMIFDHPTDPLAFEISAAASHTRHGLMRFMQRYPRFAGRCYVVKPEAIAVPPDADPDGIGTLPLDLLLLAAGAQAERELSLRLASDAAPSG